MRFEDLNRFDQRRSLIRRYDSVIGELEQIIRDANYWNGFNHQHTPIDVEDDRVLLARVKKDRETFLRENP